MICFVKNNITYILSQMKSSKLYRSQKWEKKKKMMCGVTMQKVIAKNKVYLFHFGKVNNKLIQ